MKKQILNEIFNIVSKGEIAHREQFLLLPQCFKNLSATEGKGCCMWERVNKMDCLPQ